MTRPRDVDYLQPEETAVVSARRHPLSAVDAFLVLGVAWAILSVAAGVGLFGFVWLPALASVILAVLALAAIWGAVLIHWRRATSLYTITPERAYKAYGRLRFNLLQTTYDKVTDLHIHQSVFGRIWGYGTVRLQTAGAGLALNGVEDPVGFKKQIERQRRRFLDTLIGEAPRARPSSGAEDLPVEEAVLWAGKPVAASLLGNVVVGAVALMIGVVFIIGASFIDPVAGLMGAIPLFIGVTALLSGWVQFRYTAYEVGTSGVVVTRGWLSRRRVEATYAKVTDVSVDQDIFARLFGYGKITINTAGSNEAPVVFAGIARHHEVKAIIDGARRNTR